MFTQLQKAELKNLLHCRQGETKIGEKVSLLPANTTDSESLCSALKQAALRGAKFAIVGISEDVGPRANLGRGGANDAFNSAISQFINLQSNRFLSGEQIIILGQIALEQCLKTVNEASSLTALRQATAQLDEQVVEVISHIFAAGLEPIVIGGGHNNAYGLLTAAKQVFNQPLAGINLDPHSDFRPREGRHSGNGFSYAAANGALSHYHILGLHELKNSEATLEQLSLFGASWHSLQQIWIRRELSLTQALEQICPMLNNTGLPVALELDVDAISKMPSSASTFAGIPLLDACHYIYTVAKQCQCAYLHIAEAAPQCHEAGVEAGQRDVGQAVSELIYSYLQGRLPSLS
ncbi:formimidoylglutamase [Shewanella gaetbuli]